MVNIVSEFIVVVHCSKLIHNVDKGIKQPIKYIIQETGVRIAEEEIEINKAITIGIKVREEYPLCYQADHPLPLARQPTFRSNLRHRDNLSDVL